MVFRLAPQLPAAAYRSYRALAPLSTHFRPATCQEVDCPHYLSGWETAVDEQTDLGRRQAHFIRHDRERHHAEERNRGGSGLTVFTFTPGQRCFNSGAHRTRLDRPERFFLTGGDYRGNPLRTPAREVSATAWQDDLGEHQDRIIEMIRRG